MANDWRPSYLADMVLFCGDEYATMMNEMDVDEFSSLIDYVRALPEHSAAEIRECAESILGTFNRIRRIFDATKERA